MIAKPITAERLSEIGKLCGSGNVHSANAAIPELLAEIARLQGVVSSGNEAFLVTRRQWAAERDRLQSELDHATCLEGDHLSKASRRMVDTVMGDRDALRVEVARLRTDIAETNLVLEQQDRDLAKARARIAALEAGLREACNWITDRSPDGSILVDHLRALAGGG
jgi:chromosome segregation ATPase